MAIDEALLELAIDREVEVPMVRIYRWSHPTLSIGRHQRLSSEVLSRCERAVVEVVRRPTGGTAVLHGADVTYSVVARQARAGVLETYRWVAEGLIAGMRHLGVEASIVEHRRRARTQACFASAVGADLEVAGSKICGSAQVRRNGRFLQHGSIPVENAWPLTNELLGQAGSIERSDASPPGAGVAEVEPVCLQSLRPGTTYQDVEECLIEGFTDVWGPPGDAREDLSWLEKLLPRLQPSCLTL